MNKKMEKLHKFVEREFGKQGARILVSSEEILLIMDCPMWTERSTKRIKNAFPTVDVEVESTEHSLSGFVVILRRGRIGTKHAPLVFFAVILAAMLYVAVRF